MFTGKIDRNALEAALSVELLMESIPPRNEIERQLAAIWREVLEVDSVGVTDDFVSIGGDSVAAARLVSRVRSQFDCDFTVSAAFRHGTITEQALVVTGNHPQIA